ncbi:MAG: hypothetical protein WC044_08100 [Crocinitomicaceae bacterium]
MKKILTIVLLAAFFTSCSNELEPVTKKATNKSSFFDQNQSSEESNGSATEVSIKEILQGKRYSYLKVSDGKSEYWISTLREEYELGANYFYTEAIHKTDFFSTEFNRNFEDFYLVSDLQPVHNHAEHESETAVAPSGPISASETNRAGSIKIAELVQNSKKYIGKEIQITGKVIKVNANIMDRHWVHIKDGSDDQYDFVLTTKTVVPIGHIVTFKGDFHQNVDFGSGYKFDLILENAAIVK